jgi:hypothetical protein
MRSSFCRRWRSSMNVKFPDFTRSTTIVKYIQTPNRKTSELNLEFHTTIYASFLTITDFKTLKHFLCRQLLLSCEKHRKFALHRSIALSFLCKLTKRNAPNTKNKQFINFKCTQFGVLYCTYCAFSAVKLEVSLVMEEKEKHWIISLRPEEQYINTKSLFFIYQK